MYVRKDSLDKEIKPLILKWLCSKFGYEDYPHSYRDQWIEWNIWDGTLSIRFDSRQGEQIKLLSLMPCQLKGTPQCGTLKIVNTDCFYLQLKDAISLKYPEIINSKLLRKDKHTDNDGDTFYSYHWEVFLSDNTSIRYKNQKDVMDLERRSFSYDCTIQERDFVDFLIDKYGNP